MAAGLSRLRWQRLLAMICFAPAGGQKGDR